MTIFFRTENFTDSKFDSSRIEKAIDQSNITIAKLQEVAYELKALIFDGKSFDDNHNDNDDVNTTKDKECDEQRIESFNDEFSVNDFDKADKISLSRFKQISIFEILNENLTHVTVACLENDKYIICGINGDYLEVYTIHHEKCIAKRDGFFGSSVRYCMRSGSNLIIIKANDNNITENVQGSKLTVLNGELEILAEKHMYSLISIDDFNVYSFRMFGGSQSLWVLDHKLKFHKKLYLNLDISRVFVNDFEMNDNKILLIDYETNYVRIFDVNTSSLLNVIPSIENAYIHRGSFVLYFDFVFFIEKNDGYQFLTLYDTRNDEIKRIELDPRTPLNKILLRNNDEKISFFSTSSYVIYESLDNSIWDILFS